MLALKRISRSKILYVYARSLISLGTDKSYTGLNEPVAPIPGKHPVWTQDIGVMFSELRDGANIFIHGACTSPSILTSYLCDHVKATELKNIEIFHNFALGPLPYLEDEFKGKLRLTTPFATKFSRDAINQGQADFIPISTSELPLLYRKKYVNIDYALVMVTPPDKHGFCSLGSAVGSARSAIQNAKKIIGQVNPLNPISYGDSTIHISNIDFMVHGQQNLHETPVPIATAIEQNIARHIAENLIDDGATLQIGPGRIPHEVTNRLHGHKNIGVHTEAFSDSIVDLVNLGVINNKAKNVRRGRLVASYVFGTSKVFNFINENPIVVLYDIAWVNSPEVIARNPKVTAVNSTFEIDITGQCSSDSLGGTIYSGVGGQIDFIRAASLCPDGLGKPIITLASKNSAGASTIVPTLTKGGGVVATRAHVHYIVTEYGIAYLFGKSLRQRAHALIQIAHPDFRESLEKAAFTRLNCMPSP